MRQRTLVPIRPTCRAGVWVLVGVVANAQARAIPFRDAKAPRPRHSDNDCNQSLQAGVSLWLCSCCAERDGKGRSVVTLSCLGGGDQSWCPAKKECRSCVFFSSLPIRQCALAGSEARAPGGALSKPPCSKGEASERGPGGRCPVRRACATCFTGRTARHSERVQISLRVQARQAELWRNVKSRSS